MLTEATTYYSATTSQLAAESTPTPTLGLSGGAGLVVLGVLGWAALKLLSRRNGETRALARALRGGGGFWRGLLGFFKGLFQVIAFVFRFLGGRELWGEPRSDARFWRMGTASAVDKELPPVAQLGSVAIAGPQVSPVKPTPRQPRPWAVKVVRLVTEYQGRGDRALEVAGIVAVRLGQFFRATWRVLCAIGRFFRSLYQAVAPVVTAVAGAVAIWGRWPYAARSLARVGGLALFVSWNVPAWHGWAVLALVLAFLGFVAAAVTGPGGLGLWGVVPEPTDAQRYGPQIWVVLRDDLKLPDDEPMENWLHLPDHLGADEARIVVRLPWEFRGSTTERENLNELVNSRLPGEWVSRWDFKGEDHTAVYTHKPPPKPAPECPERVGFFDPDIQEAIASCKKGEVVIGKDTFGQIIIKELGDGETPHWALSVGTGGGKSAFNQMVMAQLIKQGYHVIAVDVKRVSIENYKNVPGVHIYNDPKNPQDMRAAIEWFKDEIDARTAIKEEKRSADFPGLLLIIEESNEFADISREWWDDNRKARADDDGPAERAADPIWGTVASGARLGRFVHGNILAVFQDLRDQALGGKGLRNLFRLKFMGNYNTNQWKNVIGTTPVPDSVDKAGRMMIVEGNSQTWVQTCYADPEELAGWAIQQREQANFDPAAGLFGTPPTPSPKRLPRLLEARSRDTSLNGPIEALEGGLSGETAGELSHEGADVTLSGADVTPSRDRLRLVPYQGGQGAQGAAPDPLARPELLPLAEISRRLEGEPGIPKEATVRAHKTRRDDFPEPTIINGKELFLETQIRAYYQAQEKNA